VCGGRLFGSIFSAAAASISGGYVWFVKVQAALNRYWEGKASATAAA
jgi:hypothetical protein